MNEYIKKWYDKGIYTKADVAYYTFVGVLTTEQYKQITGDDYED